MVQMRVIIDKEDAMPSQIHIATALRYHVRKKRGLYFEPSSCSTLRDVSNQAKAVEASEKDLGGLVTLACRRKPQKE